jgi:hypothetical protein
MQNGKHTENRMIIEFKNERNVRKVAIQDKY